MGVSAKRLLPPAVSEIASLQLVGSRKGVPTYMNAQHEVVSASSPLSLYRFSGYSSRRTKKKSTERQANPLWQVPISRRREEEFLVFLGMNLHTAIA